jgi:2-polyprenyl-6-methoxyphenol hydroxylase-like FAD-dependent oxidoreductase
MVARIGTDAVVLGAGIAGLLAARVLTESFDHVTLVERDDLPGIGEHRRGVPQDRHLHAVQARGREILDELFCGFTPALVAAGAHTGDHLANIRWQLSGYRWSQADAGVQGLFVSRPFLEGHLRARVLALQAVIILDGHHAAGLDVTADSAAVRAVRIVSRGGRETALPADLVVDATGRGSRTPVWLDELGYPRPAVDRMPIGVGYTTRTYRLRPGTLGTDKMIVTGGTPAHPRAAVLAAVENGRHLLTAAGMFGDHAPTDPDGFEAFVADTLFPDISEAIAEAEPLDDPVAFRFPTSQRRRYERLPRFPQGLLVLGDAVCSFNPVYGQGITVAALQALALRDLLANGTVPTPARYFTRIARVVDGPWRIAAGGDLAHPRVPGKRPPQIRFLNAYLRRLHAAAAHDPALGDAFLRVAGLVDPPQTLLRPDRTLRVLRHMIRYGHNQPATQPGHTGAARSRPPDP